jgi:hypothetical protein
VSRAQTQCSHNHLESDVDLWDEGEKDECAKATLDEPIRMVHAPMTVSAKEKRVSDPSSHHKARTENEDLWKTASRLEAQSNAIHACQTNRGPTDRLYQTTIFSRWTWIACDIVGSSHVHSYSRGAGNAFVPTGSMDWSIGALYEDCKGHILNIPQHIYYQFGCSITVPIVFKESNLDIVGNRLLDGGIFDVLGQTLLYVL